MILPITQLSAKAWAPARYVSAAVFSPKSPTLALI